MMTDYLMGKTYYRVRLEKKLKGIIKNENIQGRILDVGSKDARYKGLFTGADYVAIDLMPQSEEVQKGSICDLDYPDESFDFILCTEVLEHVKDPFAAASEIMRVLKKGGKIIFSVPYLSLPYHNDYWRFSKEGIQILFGERCKLEFYPLGGYLTLLTNYLDTLYKSSGLFFFIIPLVLVFMMLSYIEGPRNTTMANLVLITKS